MKIMSYLKVSDLIKVGVGNKQTRKWIIENAGKYLMREGIQVRTEQIEIPCDNRISPEEYE